MTKSTITRERLEWLSQISCRDDIEYIGGDEIRELASMARAAMDSEPVAHVDPHCVHNIIWTDYGVSLENIGVGAPLFAAPQSPCSEPATVPGKWIPVSERMPDNTEPVLCIEKRADFGTYGQPFVCWHDGGGWVGKTNYRPIVTHWMPLPAVPQEVR